MNKHFINYLKKFIIDNAGVQQPIASGYKSFKPSCDNEAQGSLNQNNKIHEIIQGSLSQNNKIERAVAGSVSRNNERNINVKELTKESITQVTTNKSVNLELSNRNKNFFTNVEQRLRNLTEIDIKLKANLLKLGSFEQILQYELNKTESEISTIVLNIFKLIKYRLRRNTIQKDFNELNLLKNNTNQKIELIDSFKTATHVKLGEIDSLDEKQIQKSKLLISINHELEKTIQNISSFENNMQKNLNKFESLYDVNNINDKAKEIQQNSVNNEKHNGIFKTFISNVYNKLKTLNLAGTNLEDKISDIGEVQQTLKSKLDQMKKRISKIKENAENRLHINSITLKIKQNYEKLDSVRKYVQNTIEEIKSIKKKLEDKLDNITSIKSSDDEKKNEVDSVDKELKVTMNQIVYFQINVQQMLDQLAAVEKDPKSSLLLSGSIRLNNSIVIKSSPDGDKLNKNSIKNKNLLNQNTMNQNNIAQKAVNQDDTCGSQNLQNVQSAMNKILLKQTNPNKSNVDNLTNLFQEKVSTQEALTSTQSQKNSNIAVESF